MLLLKLASHRLDDSIIIFWLTLCVETCTQCIFSKSWRGRLLEQTNCCWDIFLVKFFTYLHILLKARLRSLCAIYWSLFVVYAYCMCMYTVYINIVSAEFIIFLELNARSTHLQPHCRFRDKYSIRLIMCIIYATNPIYYMSECVLLLE